MTIVSRSFNFYSDMQRADDIVLKNKTNKSANHTDKSMVCLLKIVFDTKKGYDYFKI